ncbi:MAG: hypothetical protein R3A52_27495 [Polyangiales bacterium]
MTVPVTTGARPVIDEVHVRREGIHVSLVVNRRQRSARLVDYLAGNFVTKQQHLDAIARREGIERIYTLVEKEESLGWSRVGYAREGTIPSYYKRSDAYLLGRVITDPPTLTEEGAPATVPADTAAAEKTLTAAKRLVPEVTLPKGVKVEVLDDHKALASGAVAPHTRKAAAWFEERFGSIGDRVHVVAKAGRAPKVPDQIVTGELQEPFGNAFVQVALHPTKADEAKSCGARGLHGCAAQIGCAFAVSPADNALAAAVRATGARGARGTSCRATTGSMPCSGRAAPTATTPDPFVNAPRAFVLAISRAVREYGLVVRCGRAPRSISRPGQDLAPETPQSRR